MLWATGRGPWPRSPRLTAPSTTACRQVRHAGFEGFALEMCFPHCMFIKKIKFLLKKKIPLYLDDSSSLRLTLCCGTLKAKLCNFLCFTVMLLEQIPVTKTSPSTVAISAEEFS